jgi:hypothetical protein
MNGLAQQGVAMAANAKKIEPAAVRIRCLRSSM